MFPTLLARPSKTHLSSPFLLSSFLLIQCFFFFCSPEPRYASLPNIMKAKKKPFKKFTLKDLGLEEAVKPRLETLSVKEPPKREGGAKVSLLTIHVHRLELRNPFLEQEVAGMFPVRLFSLE